MSQKLIRLSIHVSAESSATSSDYGAPRQPVATNDGSVIGRTAGATEQLAVDPLLPKSWTSGGQAPSPIDALVLPARTSSPRARRSSGHVLLALLLTPPRASPLMPPCGRAAGGVGGRRQPWETHENIVSGGCPGGLRPRVLCRSKEGKAQEAAKSLAKDRSGHDCKLENPYQISIGGAVTVNTRVRWRLADVVVATVPYVSLVFYLFL
jgi:hypothetical protein